MMVSNISITVMSVTVICFVIRNYKNKYYNKKEENYDEKVKFGNGCFIGRFINSMYRKCR